MSWTRSNSILHAGRKSYTNEYSEALQIKNLRYSRMQSCATPSGRLSYRALTRDQRSRGRTATSIRQQFQATVEPMHARYVAPQARWADVVLAGAWGKREVNALLTRINDLRPSSC